MVGLIGCNGHDAGTEKSGTTECSKKTLNSKKCYDYVVLCIKHFSLSPCY